MSWITCGTDHYTLVQHFVHHTTKWEKKKKKKQRTEKTTKNTDTDFSLTCLNSTISCLAFSRPCVKMWLVLHRRDWGVAFSLWSSPVIKRTAYRLSKAISLQAVIAQAGFLCWTMQHGFTKSQALNGKQVRCGRSPWPSRCVPDEGKHQSRYPPLFPWSDCLPSSWQRHVLLAVQIHNCRTKRSGMKKQKNDANGKWC